jgi:uncharacterized protein YdeI (YjbR/CyaY-like superfamily)
MVVPEDLPHLQVDSQQGWERWLKEHHQTSSGVWLRIAKKGSCIATVTYAEALDVALCYGWIDGQKGGVDAQFWLQRFTPRRRGSKWSKVNRTRAVELVQAGRMKPAGQAQVDRAQAEGTWDNAYEPQRTATVPKDLQRALDARPAAATFFATLSSSNRYAILYRLNDAKKPETRARRLAQFVAMLEEGRTLH